MIVGFHIGHDPNIGIWDNYKLSHLESERITRIKHGTILHEKFRSLREILYQIYGIKTKDVDFFVFPVDVVWYMDEVRKEESICKLFNSFTEINNIEDYLVDINYYMNVGEDLRIPNLLYGKDVYFIRHHKAHAAYTFFTSNFDKSIILSYDGIGYKNAPTMTALGIDNELTKINYYANYFLGFIYHTITNQIFKLGFNKKPHFWEGKTMALSSFGEPIYLESIIDRFYVERDPFNSIDMLNKFCVNNRCGTSLGEIDDIHNLEIIHEKLYKEKIKLNKESLIFYFANLAASWQKYFEIVTLELTEVLSNIYKTKNLCIGGGSGLNGLINDAVSINFDNVYIAPATSDCGLGIGSALYGAHMIKKHKRKNYGNVAYIGLDHKIDTKLFKKYNLHHKKYKSYEQIYEVTSKLLANDKIIGWYQGNSESGPRALGNRSILANPKNPEIQLKLNSNIKHREWFRPFAPAVLKEYVNGFFVNEENSPYMLKIAKVKFEKIGEFPSAIHVDNTARLQTVSKEDNLHFYNLLKNFYLLTGLPILLNTSFNLKGEPIVDSPEDAIKTFLNSGLDYLILKDNIIFGKQ